jgi:hypothetical protein
LIPKKETSKGALKEATTTGTLQGEREERERRERERERARIHY